MLAEKMEREESRTVQMLSDLGVFEEGEEEEEEREQVDEEAQTAAVEKVQLCLPATRTIATFRRAARKEMKRTAGGRKFKWEVRRYF